MAYLYIPQEYCYISNDVYCRIVEFFKKLLIILFYIIAFIITIIIIAAFINEELWVLYFWGPYLDKMYFRKCKFWKIKMFIH